MAGDAPPRKRIARPMHVDAWRESPTMREFEAFVASLGAAAEGSKTVAAGSYTGSCEAVRAALGLLERTEGLIDAHPPQQQSARFGNVAYRGWLDAVRDASEAEMAEFDDQHKQELAGYWWNSFGNRTRIDYGTGHETSFAVWLFALHKLDVLQDLGGAVLAVFPRYLDVCHRVQSVYRLEPAGSHGVWSLDDFHILPFVFGASQFCGSKGSGMAASPKSLRRGELVEALAGSNMLMRSVQRISEVKTGPFQEHSPLLCDLAAKVRSWKDLYRGLLKMYEGEVLLKFPVAQHFLFGPLFPHTWELSAAELEALDHPENPSGGTDGVVTKSPFAMAAARAPTSGDPLATYFGVTRRPLFAQAGSGGGLGGLHSGLEAGHGAALRHAGAGPAHALGAASSSPATGQDAATTNAAMVPHELLQGKGIKLQGWAITTNKTRISSEAELDEAKESHRFRGHAPDFPLPEMLFGQNFCRFEHAASGLVIELNALDAVCCCKIEHDVNGEPDRAMFKLPMAEKWANRKDVNGTEIKEWREDYDWTLTSTYNGTFKWAGKSEQEAPELRATDKKINYELLKRRDPILFYESLDLYEDDLFDFGESKFSIKLRVMPLCFFALARCWLRVDGTYMRSFDTRIFHEFGTSQVLVEVSKKECPVSDLRISDPRLLMDADKVEPLLPSTSLQTFEVALPASGSSA